MADKVDWVGQSGQTYSSYLRKIGTTYKDLPGVYIFVKLEIEKWSPIYVGETDSLKDRLTTNRENHHRYYCVTNHGATHICTMVVEGGEQARLDIETDIRQSYQPPCNKQ